MSPPRARQEEIETTAAEWAVRLGGEPLRPEERHALDLWLAAAPAHGAALDYACRTWAELGALRDAPGAPAELRPSRPRAWHAAAIYRAAAAVALMLMVGGLTAFWLGDPRLLLAADYRTVPGETRTLVLPDGSRVELDTASALALHFDAAARRVTLLRGEAYFTVAPMAGSETRPFIVEAADGAAKALGTEFMVNRESENAARVTVAQHQVAVAAASAMVLLSPGQSVHYDRRTGLGAVTQIDVDRTTAWRRGRLIFDRVRLADVVAELNRYRRGRIVLADTSLGERRVSGVFETADLDGALSSIALELGVRSAALPPFVTLLY